MPRTLVVETDGGSRGNPGPAASGSAVIDAATGQVLAEVGRYLGVATNNVAEYHGLLEGVKRALAIDPDARLRVRMDSKLVVEQMSGRWKIKHPAMAALAAEVRAELAGHDVTFEWVPRLNNARADALVNLALDAGADVGAVDAGAGEAAPGSTQPAAELAELLAVERLVRDAGTDRATVRSLLQAEFWAIDASGAALGRDDAVGLPDGIRTAAVRTRGCRQPAAGPRPVPAELQAHPAPRHHPLHLAMAPHRLRLAADLPPGNTAVRKRRDRMTDEWVGKTVASSAVLETGQRVPRNVRAPQGRAVGNTHPEQSARQCHRKQTACRFGRGKGETVV